jgi:hypothetical protein
MLKLYDNFETDRGYPCLMNFGKNDNILIGREPYNWLFKKFKIEKTTPYTFCSIKRKKIEKICSGIEFNNFICAEILQGRPT